MTDTANYPVDPRTVPRLPVATYVAVMLEELGFGVLTDADMERLKVTIEGFVYRRPEVAR